jgi:hypothetical protein
MSLFSKRALGICWDSRGQCTAVLMTKKGNNFRVLDFWSDKALNQDAISPLLPQAFKEMSVSENDVVIAGEAGLKCSFVDLHLPAMVPKDMKKSLSFSLSSHFPIDPTDLSWAFRVVSEKTESGQSHVRLLATKNKNWEDSLDRVGVIKVDQIIPPIAVADSVLQGSVFIQSKKEGTGFVSYKDEDGLMKLKKANEDDSAFGLGSSPLVTDNLELGPLASEPIDLQGRFVESILLALHGLEVNLTKERETVFPIPKEITPKRNVLTSTLCTAIAVYLLALGIFQLSRYVGTRKKEATNIKAITKVINADMEKNSIDTTELEKLQQFEFEIEEKVVRPASPRDVLIHITKNLPKEFYLSSFHYRGEKATCKVKMTDAAASSSTLFKVFKKVDFFEDDVQVDENKGSITLILNVYKKPLEVEEE